MNLEKFNFDFNKTYRILKRENRQSFMPRTSYYYLEWADFFQDTIIKTVEYLDKTGDTNITEDRFISTYWTTFRWLKMKSFCPTTKKSSEFKNFVSRDQNIIVETNFDKPIDLDKKWLKEIIDKEYPTISKVMEGHSFASAARELKTYRVDVSRKFKKEGYKLKQTGLI